MNIVGAIFLGAFTLVFFVVPGVVVLADRYSDKAHRVIREKTTKVKMELASRWLAEQKMTVAPMYADIPEPEAYHPISTEELINLINEM